MMAETGRSRQLLLLVCGLAGALLVAWRSSEPSPFFQKQDSVRLRALRLERSRSALRAEAHVTDEQLAQAKHMFKQTAAARLAEMKLALWREPANPRPLLQPTPPETQQLDRPSSASAADPTHYPDVPKPPRPPHCRRGFHATVLECGPGAYGKSTKPRQGFVGKYWPTATTLESLPNFADLGAPQWADKPLEIDYDSSRFQAIAEGFPKDKFAARCAPLPHLPCVLFLHWSPELVCERGPVQVGRHFPGGGKRRVHILLPVR